MNLAHRAPDHAANRQADTDAPASVVLLLFAAARVAAGTGREVLQARTVAEVLEVARSRHGDRFAAVLDTARVWVNGEPAPPERVLRAGDEVAVLPPVSGGAG
jgi:molybdopterin converting factor small subunit